MMVPKSRRGNPAAFSLNLSSDFPDQTHQDISSCLGIHPVCGRNMHKQSAVSQFFLMRQERIIEIIADIAAR